MNAHPTTSKVQDFTIDTYAQYIKVGDELEQGRVTKVLPMSGFSVMQIKVDTRTKPIVLNKKDKVVIRRSF